MLIKQKPLSEVVSNAIRILISHIGAADTARFINCFSVGFGDNTETDFNIERIQAMPLRFKEIADSISSLSLQEKAYLAKMLLADIEEKECIGATEMPQKRTFGEYIGKIKMSEDFNEPLPDTFWLGESDEIAA
jgi:hypothetical protein